MSLSMRLPVSNDVFHLTLILPVASAGLPASTKLPPLEILVKPALDLLARMISTKKLNKFIKTLEVKVLRKLVLTESNRKF